MSLSDERDTLVSDDELYFVPRIKRNALDLLLATFSMSRRERREFERSAKRLGARNAMEACVEMALALDRRVDTRIDEIMDAGV